VFGWIRGIGGWFGRPLLFGDALPFASLVLLIPGTELRGGLIESKTHRDRDGGRDQQEKDQALTPKITATLLIAKFVQIGQGRGGFGPSLIGIVDDETAARNAIGCENHPHTGDQQVLPRNLGVAKHP
jgi:hypothetical protein